MGTEKQEYIPLHERIQQAKKDNNKTLLEKFTKENDLNDLYKSVFETDIGQRLLSHLVDAYIGHVPAVNATPQEIMFQHGQNYIVHDILNRIKRT